MENTMQHRTSALAVHALMGACALAIAGIVHAQGAAANPAAGKPSAVRAESGSGAQDSED